MLLNATIITTDRKNINVTITMQAKIYIIYVLIAFKLCMIGLSPNGCNNAATTLYMKAMTAILIAGKAAMKTIISKPMIPIVFFNSNVADKTVSAASVSVLPTTGIKLPAINFVVFSAIRSEEHTSELQSHGH